MVKKISKWLLYGLVGAFAVGAIINPQKAYATTQAVGGIGSALSSLGGGIKSLGSGVGFGVASLFNPLFTLRDLIYGPQAGVQVQSDIEQVTSTGNIQASQIAAQQTAIELDPAAPFTPITTGFGGVPLSSGFSFNSRPLISPGPVAQVMVHGQSLPLSQAAISHYQQLGVTVSPESNQTIQSQNSNNATSPSSASSNYQSGAAQAAGFSTGSPR